jgi:hypothetical protein
LLLHESLNELVEDTWITVRYDDTWGTVLACNLIVQSGGKLFTTHCLLAGVRDGILGQPVSDIEKKVTCAARLREGTDPIEADLFESCFRDRKGDWWSWWLGCRFAQPALLACADKVIDVQIETRQVEETLHLLLHTGNAGMSCGWGVMAVLEDLRLDARIIGEIEAVAAIVDEVRHTAYGLVDRV